MNRYLVSITTTVTVEAKDEEEAVDIAVDTPPETANIQVEELDDKDATLIDRFPPSYDLPTSPLEVDD